MSDYDPMNYKLPDSLFMEFSRQQYWSRLLFPTLRDLPNPGTEPKSLASPILAGRGFITVPIGKHKLLLNNFSVLKVTFFSSLYGEDR